MSRSSSQNSLCIPSSFSQTASLSGGRLRARKGDANAGHFRCTPVHTCAFDVGIQKPLRLDLPTFRDSVTLSLDHGGEFCLRRNGINRGVFLSVLRDRPHPAFTGIEIATILDAGAR
jgi:hypothetical protein